MCSDTDSRSLKSASSLKYINFSNDIGFKKSNDGGNIHRECDVQL